MKVLDHLNPDFKIFFLWCLRNWLNGTSYLRNLLYLFKCIVVFFKKTRLIYVVFYHSYIIYTIILLKNKYDIDLILFFFFALLRYPWLIMSQAQFGLFLPFSFACWDLLQTKLSKIIHKATLIFFMYHLINNPIYIF